MTGLAGGLLIGRLGRVLVTVLVLVLAVAGSAPARASASARGPLRVPAGSVTTTAAVPAHADGRWMITAGFMPLCGKEPTRVALRSVTYDGDVEPIRVIAWLHTIPAHVPRGMAGTVFNSYGKPGDDTNGWRRVAGTFQRLRPGHPLRFTSQCARAHTRGTELLLTVVVPRRGATVTAPTVHYRSGGAPYTATFHWTLNGCGTEAQIPDCTT